MKTTVIIVTYANRYNYIKQVVESVQQQGVVKILIVNNDSSIESSRQLCLLAKNNSLVEIINLDKNTGSAFALNVGIKKAIIDDESDFFWLLDDDNLPSKYALEALRSSYQKSSISKEKLLLASLRTIKKNYIKAVKNKTPEITIGWENGFRSFHIFHFLSNKKHFILNDNIKSGEVHSVPYGGMFFHKDLIMARGGFNEAYYIYLDDTEFCLKHREAGGVIICVLDSLVYDLEVSCYNINRTIVNFATKDILFHMYYYIRNRVYFEKKYLVTSWPIYIVNMIIYSTSLTFLALLNFKFKNIKIYYRALFHGLIGKMGCNKDFVFYYN